MVRRIQLLICCIAALILAGCTFQPRTIIISSAPANTHTPTTDLTATLLATLNGTATPLPNLTGTPAAQPAAVTQPAPNSTQTGTLAGAIETAIPQVTPPAEITQTETLSAQPTAVSTPTQAAVTAAPVQNSTATPSGKKKPEGCNKILFIIDVNYPDGTVVKSGDAIHKTWRLKNVGTCTWTSSYKLIFDTGDTINGPAQVPLTGDTVPGQLLDLSVDLTAPAQAGDYKGYWRLQDDAGNSFGLGTSNVSFWVEIIVK
jgi:hypothetical protein